MAAKQEKPDEPEQEQSPRNKKYKFVKIRAEYGHGKRFKGNRALAGVISLMT
jgi:hypothetical protein